MSEMKHTPGPWRVEEGTTLIWGDCNPDDTTTFGLGYPIAECKITPSASWAKGPRKYEEAEANAHLIAAAPELFESLKYMVAVFDQRFDTPEEANAINTAINVLATARGDAA